MSATNTKLVTPPMTLVIILGSKRQWRNVKSIVKTQPVVITLPSNQNQNDAVWKLRMVMSSILKIQLQVLNIVVSLIRNKDNNDIRKINKTANYVENDFKTARRTLIETIVFLFFRKWKLRCYSTCCYNLCCGFHCVLMLLLFLGDFWRGSRKIRCVQIWSIKCESTNVTKSIGEF